MSDYIKRENALSAVKHAWAKGLEPSQYIEIIPVADVAEVKHGKWIGTLYDGYADGSPVYEEFECSLCGCEHNADGEPTWSYCPDCGAKMDLEE